PPATQSACIRSSFCTLPNGNQAVKTQRAQRLVIAHKSCKLAAQAPADQAANELGRGADEAPVGVALGFPVHDVEALGDVALLLKIAPHPAPAADLVHQLVLEGPAAREDAALLEPRHGAGVDAATA